MDDGRDEGVELLKTGGHCLEAKPTTSKRIFSTKGLRFEKKFTFKNRYIFIILVFVHVGWHLSILEHSQNDSVIVYNKVVYIHDPRYTTFAEEFLEHNIMIFS